MVDSIKEILDKNNNKSEIWINLNQIVSIIMFIHVSLKQINDLDLWKGKRLMNTQLIHFKTVFDIGTFEFLIEQKNKLDESIRQNKRTSHKSELIEMILQPRLIQVMIKQLKKSDYENVANLILNETIPNQAIKEEVLYKCQSLINKNINKKRIGLSINGFKNKYHTFLGLESNEKSKTTTYNDYSYLLKKILNKGHIAFNDALKDYIHLVEQNSTWSYDQLQVMYDLFCSKTLGNILKTQQKNSQYFLSMFFKLEHLISFQYENKIKSTLGVSKGSEFEQLLANLVNQRLTSIASLNGCVKLRELFARKSALYARIAYYCANNIENQIAKSQLLRKLTLLITYAMHGTMPFDEIQTELSKSEIEFFKSIGVNSVEKKIKSENILYEAFEEALFNISEIQYEILELTLKQIDLNEKNKELIELDKKLSDDIIKKIASQDITSRSTALKGLKIFIQSLHEQKQEQNRKNAINDILQGKGNN